uniref:Allorecognition 2 n=3 Tax=Hydractinia symbiolongicarpus TaxID=13093 RepID=D9ZGA7_HYDSY|nr:allorecognition 2 [Hydractinia symbiolongicarpus]ADK97776.1 allorecognition 2 [Hydractinia symbiolongicarpus]
MLNIAILSLSCYINYVSCLSLTSPAIIEEVVGRSVTITYVTDVADVADDIVVNFRINYNDSRIAEGTKIVFDKTPSTPFGNRLRTSTPLQNQKEYSLLIDNLKYNDTGLFFAVIRIFDPNFEANSTTNLIIYGGPSIISNLSSTYTVEENTTNYKIPIILQGHPKPQVTWEFDGNKNVRVETIDEKKRKYKYILTISMITREMNGKVLSYKAVGYNDNKVVGSTKLNVTYSPTFCDTAVKEVIEFADIASAMFTTRVCGNPMPTVSMGFGGQSVAVTLNTTEKNKYKYTANLTSYLKPSRCGRELIATAENSIGEKTSKVVLKYKFTPGKVQNLKSSRKDKCIDTSWKNLDTGNCEVWYTVKYYGGEELLHEQNTSSGKVGASFCNSDKVPKVNITRIVAVSNDTFKQEGEEEIVTVVVAKDETKPGTKKTVIIVVVCLLTVLLVIILVVCWIVYKKKKNKQDPEKESTGSGRRPLNQGTPLPHHSDADGYAIADDLIENNVERKNNTEGISLAQLDDGTYDQLEVMNDNPYIKNGASVDNAAAKANPPNNMKTYDSATNAVDKQPKKPEVYAYSRPRNTGDYNGVNPLAGKSTNQNLYSEPERQTSPEQPLGAGKSGAANPNLYAQVEKDRKQPSKGEKYQPQHYDKVCDPPEVPAHIQQMYAQIDKSKKQKK